MIDIVIPYRKTSEDDTELRYALRSVELYLTGVGNIYLVGDKPDWITGVTHLAYPGGTGMKDKERNIYCKLIVAAGQREISDTFLYMNDDHFLLEPFEAAAFPYYYKGLLGDLLENKTPYRFTVENTIELLGRHAVNWDCHCPIVFDKHIFAKAFDRADWNKDWGYCMKTIYCHYAGIETGAQGEYSLDIKYYHANPANRDYFHPLIDTTPYFSTDDKAMDRNMIDMLEKLYPKPSKYEK